MSIRKICRVAGDIKKINEKRKDGSGRMDVDYENGQLRHFNSNDKI